MAAARRPMVNLLGRVPLFDGCTRTDLSRIAALSEERIYQEGQVIVKAGDPGNAFYVITNGKVKVVAGKAPSGKKEAELGRGEFFGELSLLDGDARTRTVVAETPLETVRIERTAFRKLL
ncbi:MAG: cyclic nucleotide-binding domain-containing protein, partial [Actinomycetota bacterium]